ncbi:MAG TPA: polysaccharide biosynthesis/export family protein [Bryobacteraceae bacterium]|nr:polysaccharide biosynthesis/export family protein [Bryobacteraceae bacterium]
MTTLVLLLCLAAAGFAQPRPAATTDSPATNLPAHPIGANDLLSVSVYDAPELSRMVRVSADGNIRLPMLRSRIKVAGSMPAQVEGAIAEALEKEEILIGPVVTVTVAEYHSRPIIVAGAVKQPQTFQAIGPMRLLDAISKAGGLSEHAGSEILVSKPGAEVQRVPVKGLLESADDALNVALAGGEEIRVVEAGKAFVVGNVKKPGSFVLRDSDESTVLQMLALAEGLTAFSSKQAYIYRREANGTRREIPVELDQILRRKRSDVAVVAADILYVPENKGRKLSIAALERALLFGSTAGATALIYAGR